MPHNSIRKYRIAWDNRILLTEVGSGLHGVSIKGTDDHDEMGICIEPPECVIGLEPFEQYIDRWHADGTRIREGERSGHGDTDHTVYSLRKWTKLAAQGNPTVLMPLWAPNQSVLWINDFGRLVRDSRSMFVSKEAGRRFLGYSTSQRAQMLGLKGKKHTNRPELVEKYGFDTKFAYHALRLTVQGSELMSTGEITLPVHPEIRDYLLGVRNGHYTLDEVVAWLDDAIAWLRYSVEHSRLPEGPNYGQINQWLTDMYMFWWKERGLWKDIADLTAADFALPNELEVS